jgi:hypothetical protein
MYEDPSPLANSFCPVTLPTRTRPLSVAYPLLLHSTTLDLRQHDAVFKLGIKLHALVPSPQGPQKSDLLLRRCVCWGWETVLEGHFADAF